MKEVIAIFDIGKTNKKILLFDQELNVIYQHEQSFEEITDEDGFACDDIDKIKTWMSDIVYHISVGTEFRIKAINFATYGASLVYLDTNGKRLTPVYNYLKPMPPAVLGNFYESYGGVEEFSCKTASPALGMLNSGLQALWLKRTKPGVFARVTNILHFPQYLSYCFTGKITSEYTSIGCHTAMWNFEKMQYHQWLKDEQINLPEPVSNSITYPVSVNSSEINVGIGIHDSSSSLVPYLAACTEPFILISTGTWCIFMNPFNHEPLTTDQLKQDTLCYMSVHQKQVKSSRLFLGHIHGVNVKHIADSFGVDERFYRALEPDEALLEHILKKNDVKVFFKNGIPDDYVDNSIPLKQFNTAEEAYHQLVVDLARLAMEALKLVISKEDNTKAIYISGGFARNEIFVRLLATWFPHKKVYTSEIDNSTALGAALAIWEKAFGNVPPIADLGLREFNSINKKSNYNLIQ